MKKISLIVAIALMVLACGKTNLTINGTVATADFDGQKIYIASADLTPFDSTEVKKGKFTFHCLADTPKIAVLIVGNSDNKQLERRFIYEEGTIAVSIDPKDKISISGTTLNDSYSDFLIQNAALDKKYENALNISEKAAEEVDKEYVELGYKFAKENPKNIVGKIAFLSAYWGMSIAQREEIIALLDDSFKTDTKIAKIIATIEQEKRASVGQPFIDFTAPDTDGNELTLSSLIGKTDYLLIDFWASWCGPCIKSLPSLKALYNKHKGNHFAIIGVSLDSKKDDWIGAINKFQLTWTNVSDLKKWDSYPAQLYAVSFIPTTILLDKTGNIVGRNLHVNEIDDILSKK